MIAGTAVDSAASSVASTILAGTCIGTIVPAARLGTPPLVFCLFGDWAGDSDGIVPEDFPTIVPVKRRTSKTANVGRCYLARAKIATFLSAEPIYIIE